MRSSASKLPLTSPTMYTCSKGVRGLGLLTGKPIIYAANVEVTTQAMALKHSVAATLLQAFHPQSTYCLDIQPIKPIETTNNHNTTPDEKEGLRACCLGGWACALQAASSNRALCFSQA